MFSFLKTQSSPVEGAVLHQLIDEILTPALTQMGLGKTDAYNWHEHTVKEIRRGFTYCLLKGGTATLTWGVNLDFIPRIYGNKLVYYKTPKKYCHHLFEWPEGYSNSFLNIKTEDGKASHRGYQETKKSITGLFKQQLPLIKDWYNKADNIEDLLTLAQKQLASGTPYTMHAPSPQYVLAFLYARTNQLTKAIELFDSLDLFGFANNESLKEKARVKLLSLAAKTD